MAVKRLSLLTCTLLGKTGVWYRHLIPFVVSSDVVSVNSVFIEKGDRCNNIYEINLCHISFWHRAMCVTVT